MTVLNYLSALIIGLLVVAAGATLLTPIVFAGRVTPGVFTRDNGLTGLALSHVPAALATIEQQIIPQTVTLSSRGHTVRRQLAELGITLDRQATAKNILDRVKSSLLHSFAPVDIVINIDTDQLSNQLLRDFSTVIKTPVNASVTVAPNGTYTVVASQAGEVLAIEATAQQLVAIAQGEIDSTIINLNVTTAPARVSDEAALEAIAFAQDIAQSGLKLTFDNEVITMKPSTVRRLLEFSDQADATPSSSSQLNVQLNPAELRNYLVTTLAPIIDQPATNARFTLDEGRITQFSLPVQGQILNVDRSISHIITQLRNHQLTVPLAVDISLPEVASLAGMQDLGLDTLLAVGESDYQGSPRNRTINIVVGADRYHGLLIPPGVEFSFNEFLGPVTAAAGFTPELVIKNNVTTPEYGGGLCQVSTTVFRAAIKAGLEITDRRNHSYAVSYYGTPGLDATIYPPYTDLRFLNNTPGYILIQRRIEGTKLSFEFWGTDDGRQVTISEPEVYDLQANGAVKAFVEQKVIRDGEVIVDDSFYSRYKSPSLFPKVLSANGEKIP